MKTDEQTPTVCPRCGHKEIAKLPLIKHASGRTVTKYKCKKCDYKFTQQQAKLLTKGKKHQTGKTSIDLDKAREAKKPGKRTVKHEDGTTTEYYEFRRNRSDIDPAKRL